jgi:hypothetical protein
MASHEADIVREAARVARLQLKIRKLAAETREARGELKIARKNLRALAQAKLDPFVQAAPLRMFGERQG